MRTLCQVSQRSSVISRADIYTDGPSAPTTSGPSFHYGGSYLLNTVQAIQHQDHATKGLCDKLQHYLKSGAESMADIIGWWGVSVNAGISYVSNGAHKANTRYPTLRWIAWDYLAIQGSATPSERAFSSGGITGCAWRNRLKPRVFESLQLLKSAYWNGWISGCTQAENHVEDLTDDDNGDDDTI